ncbi:hypothetical protein SAMN04488128_1021445 [Chitinophaga eiseniae]|uniref:Uncharacterized protein n=1 Tax=Chitinophaga eiseniae TaxID=634771 RepID=A0A1T4RSR4_9BACT|nr:hypothetical protein SAMN04488128_1021445 [Chitinophaga eiseniae]
MLITSKRRTKIFSPQGKKRDKHMGNIFYSFGLMNPVKRSSQALD